MFSKYVQFAVSLGLGAEGSGTGELSQRLGAARKGNVRFPAPTAGGSEPSVTLAEGD